MAKIFVYGDAYGSFGTSQADTFNVTGSYNTLVGGAGNDTYNLRDYVDGGHYTAHDNTIVEISGGGTDTVNYFGYWAETDYTYLADNVENLNLREYADVGYGNALGNVMRADVGDVWNGTVMFGGDGNDTIFGSHYGDSLYGDGGNDSITGGNFNDDDDWIYGGDGNDSLSGGNVTDVMDPGEAGYGGDDSIYGQAGNDTISGGDTNFTGSTGYGYHAAYAGDDNLEGGYGDDLILGGNDRIRMNGSYGYIYGGEDWMYGDDGNDTIIGGNNVLYGAEPEADFGGYNSAWGSQDTLYGGAGNDVLRGGNTTIIGGGQNLKAYGGYGDFYGMAGNDSMVAGNVLIRMGDGGGYGYGNGDTAGSWSGDEMFGGAGNDTMHSGNVTVIGGGGRDYITGSGEVLYGDIYNESYEEGESAGNDSITDGNDLLEGGAGRDTLYGGYNMFYGDEGNDTLVGGSDTLRGGAGDDTIYGGVDKFYGGDGNDRITAGNESIDGGTGQNLIINGYAVMYGRDGNDTLTGGNTDDIIVGEYGNDSMLGNAGNDSIDAADEGLDFADGGAGDDTVYGSDHGDTIAGGLGDDILVINFYYGGSITVSDAGGDDRVIVHGDRDGSFTLGAGIEGLSNHASFTTLVGNTLDNYIEGSTDYQAETILGLAGNDVLDGHWGDDRLVGGAGNDTYHVYTAYDVVVENAGEGIDTVFAYGAYGVLPDNVENLILGDSAGYGAIRGNSSANLLMGNGNGNVIEGGAGNDTIDGGDGADVLIGGAGDDSYTIRDSNAVIIEQAGAGTDSVRIFDVSGPYRLGNNIENAVLGDVFHDVAYGVTGNASNNRLEGNKWDNYLDGGAGNDTLIGGAGDDNYTVDKTTDVVTEAAGGGDDWFNVMTTASTGTFTMAANVESGQLFGAAGLGLTGNASDNLMYGNAGGNAMNGGLGNDEIYAKGGNDSLTGDAGNDLLDGERGNDTMAGGAGNDTYYVDRGDGAGTAISSGEDVVTELAASGTDKVFSSVYTYSLGANVENLELEDGGARKGFGNELGNTITGNSSRNLLSGAAGSDSLAGGTGDDTLLGGSGNDTLVGGDGFDIMAGNAGNDTYTVDSGGDVVSEAFNEGTDVVQASVSYTLTANVENLILAGGAYSGEGNSLANLITGTSGGNSLFGDGGNDTLVGNDGGDILNGATGNDSMAGGTGDDTYWVDATADVINEGVNWGYDTMYVESLLVGNYLLAANVETLTLSMNEGGGFSTINHNATGNAQHNTINGNAGNNSLSGLGGEDTISGGTGNDVLSGGTENDELFGGIGNDTIFGDAGDDELDGETGFDSMSGGTGDDLYWVFEGDGASTVIGAANEDVVVEALNAGRDTVIVMRGGVSTYAAPDNIEVLRTAGAGAMTLTGNGLNNAFHVGTMAGGDSFDGGAGTDTLHGSIGNAGTAAASLTSFDSAVFDVYIDLPGSIWTLDVNGMNAVTLQNGAIYNDADLSVIGLGANAVVTLNDLENNSGGSLLSFALDDASGGSDKITFKVGGGGRVIQNLGVAGVETLAFNVATGNFMESHFNVAGVTGESLFSVTGGVAESAYFTLSGLDDSQTFLFQNFAGAVSLGLAESVTGVDSFVLDLDNAHIDDLSLSGLDSLTLDTRGDPGFANGGSFVSGATASAVVIEGGQDLTLSGVSTSSVDASGFSGDLDIFGWTTTFTAGSGNDTVALIGTNVTLDFGANLDGNDSVSDDSAGDTDVLNAEFEDGADTALFIQYIETVNIDVGPGTVVLDVSKVHNGGNAMTVDIDGTGANVTLNASESTYNALVYNASGLDAASSLTFIGGNGSVTVTASAGNDTLNGSYLPDVLTGGAGNDTFVFDELGGGADAITDFADSGDDTLAFSLSIFGDIGPIGTLGEGLYASGAGMTTATTAEVRFFLNETTGNLYYDADGNGTVESAQHIAWLDGPPALTEADFQVIS
jgi:Ca2+-binding RTX toxin-like protein